LAVGLAVNLTSLSSDCHNQVFFPFFAKSEKNIGSEKILFAFVFYSPQ